MARSSALDRIRMQAYGASSDKLSAYERINARTTGVGGYSYYTIDKWQKDHDNSYATINDYYSRIGNGDWLSSDDRAAYKSAIDTYTSTGTALRNLRSKLNNSYSPEAEEDWLNWQKSSTSLGSHFADVDAFYGQFADDVAYNNWKMGVTPEEQQKWYQGWFKNGAFSDGYQFGDVTKSLINTAFHVGENATQAAVDATENLIDTHAYAVGAIGGLFNKDFQGKVGDFIGKDLLRTEKTGRAIHNVVSLGASAAFGGAEENSFLGSKSEGLVQSASHMAGSMLLQKVGVPTAATMGVNAFGSEIESAFAQGAGYGEAGISGAVSAGAEILFEKLFGGFKVMKGNSLSDGAIKWVSDKIGNSFLRVLAKGGMSATFEGFEELATEFTNAAVKKMTYLNDKEFNEIMNFDTAMDAFVGGVIMGSGGNAIQTGAGLASVGRQDVSPLVNAGLEIDPNNRAMQTYQTKLDAGQRINAFDRYEAQNAAAETLRDYDSRQIGGATRDRLNQLGETGNIDRVADALTKRTIGEDLSLRDKAAIRQSQYGERVGNELDRKNIESGMYSSRWAEGIGTKMVNADVYNRREVGADRTVEVTRQNIRPRNQEQIDLIEKTAREKIERVEGFTKEAADAMIKGYDGRINATEYISKFDEAFKLGKAGASTTRISNLSAETGIKGGTLLAAYDLGRQARENSTRVLQSNERSGIIKESEAIGNEGKIEREGIRLREGGERLGGANSEGQVRRVEGYAGRIETGTEIKPRDLEAADLLNAGREVRVADLGILNGSKTQTVRVVDAEMETATMKRARKEAEAHGLKVRFFLGDDIVIEEKNGSLANINGYILGDQMLVRADHESFTAEQITRHEMGHDTLARVGAEQRKVIISDTRKRLSEIAGEDSVTVDTLSSFYSEAYKGSGLSEDEIWEEIICDSLGDMNIFAKDRDMGRLMEMATSDIRDIVGDSKLLQGVNEGKYSRESGLIDYINDKSGRENDNLSKQQQVAKVRSELSDMKVGTGEIMAINKVADKMYEQYGGDASISEFRYAFLEASRLALSEDGYEAAYEIIDQLARETVYNPKNIGGEADTLAEIKRELKGTKFAVHEADKTSGEFDSYGGFGAFRKKMFGKVNLANSGIQVDVKYAEMQNLYGKEFFPDVNTVSEQLMQIEKIMNTPLSDYMFVSEQELNDTADEMTQSLFSTLGNIWTRSMQTIDFVASKQKAGSARELLANALESVAQNEGEAKRLKEYKANIEGLNEQEKKLWDLKRQMKELSFGKGTKDMAEMKKVREEITKTENRINLYDKKLLDLESTSALKAVMEREKKNAYRAAAEKGREALHKNVVGRQRTAEIHSIQKIAKELDGLLNRGTKEKNVKKGGADFVRSALDLSNMLFASDDDLLLSGIKTEYTDSEAKAMDDYMRLYEEYHSYDNAVTENKARRAELRSQMADIKHGFSDALERERKRISNAKASDTFDALIKEYKNLQNSSESYIRETFDKDKLGHIEALKEKVGNTTLKDMSLEQLKVVHKAFTITKTMVQNSNKLFVEGKKASVKDQGEQAIHELELKGHKKTFTTPGKKASTFGYNNLKPIYLMERTGSAVLQEQFQNVMRGEDTYAKDIYEAEKFFEGEKGKHGYNKWDFKKTKTFDTGTGLKYDLTLGQMMSIYAYSKRGEQAMEHLRTDGFVYDGAKKVKGKGGITYELNDKTAYKISDKVFLEIVNSLTKEQKAFVDATQKYLSEVMGAKGNEVSEKLVGIDLFGEENYFPIRSERAYLERAREQASGEIKIKNKGFTKQTQKGARNAIVLSDYNKIWGEHVSEMSMYHAFTLPLEDFYRVYNYQTASSEDANKKGVIPALSNAYGEGMTQAIDRLLSDLNGGARSDSLEGEAKKLISLHKKAKTMASLSVIVQQPSSIIRAQAMVDPKYFVGQKVSKGGHKAKWEEIKTYAPVAIIKEMGHFDVGMGRSSADWIVGKKTVSDHINEVLSKPASYADEVGWISIWDAVKRETARSNPKMNTSSEDFLKKAGERFEDVIRHTQVYDSTLSKSANMRSKSAFMQMLTSFMAEPTTSINMREMALRSGDVKRIARTTAAVYASTLLNSALVALPYAFRDDDEDETFVEKYAAALSTSFVDNINPINSIPILKDVWSLGKGYSVERADMSLAEDVLNSFKGVIKSATAEEIDKSTVVNSVIELVGDLSSFLGIPVDNIYRDVKSYINFGKTISREQNGMETTWNSISDALEGAMRKNTPVVGWFGGESKGKRLYDAILAEDDAYVSRFRAEYEEEYADIIDETIRETKIENAYNSAVRKALRDNDPRVEEAALAKLSGDEDKYWDLMLDIIEEGIFDENLVKEAFEAEYDYHKNKKKDAELRGKTYP